MARLSIEQEQLTEIVAEASKRASREVRIRGRIIAALLGAVAALVVCIPTTIVLTSHAESSAHSDARANCLQQAAVRPQGNVRVLLLSLIYDIASLRATNYPQSEQERENKLVNFRLSQYGPFTAGELPKHIISDSELVKYLRPLPLIDCGKVLQ